MVKDEKITPGTGWYWFAILLLLVGVLLPVAVLRPLFRGHMPAQLVAPGTNIVRLEACDYVLWNDHTTLFEGKTYASSSNLPGGVAIRLVSQGSSQAVPMTPDASTRVRTGNAARQSVGKFSVPAAGQYALEISGAFAPRVFSLREPQFAAVVGAFSILAVAESIACIGAPVIIGVVAMGRARARARARRL